MIEPLIISWGWESDHPGPSKFVDHLEYTGTRDIAAFLAVEDAIRFQQKFDWDDIRTYCHSLLGDTLSRIQDLTQQPALWTNSDHWYSQMASAILPPAINVDELKIKLYDDFQIEVPVLEWNHTPLIRLSIQGYNNKTDVDRLLEALKQLL